MTIADIVREPETSRKIERCLVETSKRINSKIIHQLADSDITDDQKLKRFIEKAKTLAKAEAYAKSIEKRVFKTESKLELVTDFYSNNSKTMFDNQMIELEYSLVVLYDIFKKLEGIGFISYDTREESCSKAFLELKQDENKLKILYNLDINSVAKRMLEIEIIKEEEERRISYFVVNEEDMDNPHKLESTKKLFEYLKNNVNQHHFNIIQYILDGIPFVVKEALRKKNERFEEDYLNSLSNAHS
jgi:hypothetical protein